MNPIEKNLYDLIIIGGGPGGLSASLYAARANLKTVLLESKIPGGQVNNTDEVENYLGIKKKNGTDLALDFLNHAKTYNIEIMYKEAISLYKTNNIYNISLLNKQILKSYSVILATGGYPRKLQIPGEKKFYGNGVSYCATCDGFFFKNKTVLVVGGGDSAVEEASFLATICNKVYISHRRDKLRASKLLQKRLLKKENVFPLWDSIPVEIISNKNEINGVKIKNIKTNKTIEIKADGVFVFIGYEPNNTLLPKEVSINSQGLVITNEICETSIPGLYAIGDLRSKFARQIVLSVADGCNAALSAAKYIEKIKENKICK